MRVLGVGFLLLAGIASPFFNIEAGQSRLREKIAEASARIVAFHEETGWKAKLRRFFSFDVDLDEETLQIILRTSSLRPPRYLNVASWLIAVSEGTPDYAFESIEEFGLFLRDEKNHLMDVWRGVPRRHDDLRKNFRNLLLAVDQAPEFKVSHYNRNNQEKWLKNATDKLAYFLIRKALLVRELTLSCGRSLE